MTPWAPGCCGRGYPNSAFRYGVEAHSIGLSKLSAFFIIVLLTLAGVIGWTLALRTFALTAAKAASRRLEQRVAERTAEISYLAAHDALTGLANRSRSARASRRRSAAQNAGRSWPSISSISTASNRSTTRWDILSATNC